MVIYWLNKISLFIFNIHIDILWLVAKCMTWLLVDHMITSRRLRGNPIADLTLPYKTTFEYDCCTRKSANQINVSKTYNALIYGSHLSGPMCHPMKMSIVWLWKCDYNLICMVRAMRLTEKFKTVIIIFMTYGHPHVNYT